MIPVNEPLIAPEAIEYVTDCLKSGWVSSAGKYIEKFESGFSAYLGVRHATTTTNGTTALHLALAALRIGPGDEVIMPDLTIVSCGLAALYVGATPVFVDVDPETGNMNPSLLETVITKRTKAILVVHLYGYPADMDPILRIARKHNLKIIEDAAEAHGAEYKGKQAGSIGDVGCFSFYGNKIVTTGEGGMVVTNDTALYTRAKLLKDLAHSPSRRFYHEEVGFNFRMTNMQAALGLAQLKHIDEYIGKKLHMEMLYRKQLRSVTSLSLPSQSAGVKSVYWMYGVVLRKGSPVNRDELRKKLKENGIDSRDYFFPLHRQPIFRKFANRRMRNFPVSDRMSNDGLYLPSGLAITDEQISAVCHVIKRLIP
jgi:perosamine synthetase